MVERRLLFKADVGRFRLRGSGPLRKPTLDAVDRSSVRLLGDKLALSTHRSRRRFSERTTGPPWNLTFANAAAKVGDGDRGRSRAPTDDRDNFEAECLHPMVTNWRCRPQAELHAARFTAAKLPFNAVIATLAQSAA